jgi:hypothetical protein
MNLAASDLQFNGDLDNRPIEIAQLCVLYQLECCCILWHMSYVKLQRALANRPYKSNHRKKSLSWYLLHPQKCSNW